MLAICTSLLTILQSKLWILMYDKFSPSGTIWQEPFESEDEINIKSGWQNPNHLSGLVTTSLAWYRILPARSAHQYAIYDALWGRHQLWTASSYITKKQSSRSGFSALHQQPYFGETLKGCFASRKEWLKHAYRICTPDVGNFRWMKSLEGSETHEMQRGCLSEKTKKNLSQFEN